MVWYCVPAMLSKTDSGFSILNHGGAVLFEPPFKISRSSYMCDKVFHLDHILDMYNDKQMYGLVYITGKTYAFYKISKTGSSINHELVVHGDVSLPNKHNKGGQSAPRFQRLHEEREDAYIKKLGELAINTFMSDNHTKYVVEKLVIAGPGDKKKLLYENELITQYFHNKLAIVTVEDMSDKTITSLKYLFESDIATFYDKLVKEVQEMMQVDYDRLLFSFDEIVESQVKRVICEDTPAYHELFHSIDAEIVYVPSDYMKQLGLSLVGVRFY